MICSAPMRRSTSLPISRLGTEYVLVRTLIVLLRLTRIPLMMSSVSSIVSGSGLRWAESSRNFFRRFALARLIRSSTKLT